MEPAIAPAELTFGGDQDDMIVVPVVSADNKPEQHCPTQLRKSVAGHHLYNTYAPRTAFLQLGTMHLHRSAIKASCLMKMTKAEQLLAMATSDVTCDMIDNVMQKFDPKLTTQSEDKIKMWGYLMTQWSISKINVVFVNHKHL